MKIPKTEELGICPEAAHGIHVIKEDKSYETEPLFLRTMGVTMTHDFDSMVDRARLYSRSAPWKSMERHGFTFEKLCVMFDLPPKGTAEREGADLVLGILADFLDSHR
jgi:hypothetical protein